MATRAKAPFFIRLLSFWGKLALFAGIAVSLFGPGLLPMALHHLPPELYWLLDGGNLVSIGIFMLVPTLFYRVVIAVVQRVNPQAIAEQLRSLHEPGRSADTASTGWREPQAPRRTPAPPREDRNAPLQRSKPDEPVIRGRRTRTPLIRR